MSISAINGHYAQSANYQKSKIGNNCENKVGNSANPSFGINPSGFEATIVDFLANCWPALAGAAAAALFAFVVISNSSNNPLDH